MMDSLEQLWKFQFARILNIADMSNLSYFQAATAAKKMVAAMF